VDEPAQRERALSTDWEAVYRATYHEVVGFLSGMLLDHERAKDMAQDAFARVIGMEADNPRGLVFRTAANLARDEARLVVRRKRHLKLLRVEEDVRAERVTTPAKELERKERAERVRKALELLSETDRQVLLLWNAGFDYDEIAERAGLARGAIGTTVARAKKKLVMACATVEDTDAALG
jgi:RNA polymerase sigma-70 factor (ECF subfamily)